MSDQSQPSAPNPAGHPTGDPPAVPVDDRDWTWVLERPCPECGFDAQEVPLASIGARIRSNAARWRELLAHPAVHLRPRPDVWSALEYGCHVRDVNRLFTDRLRLMLTEQDPLFPNWDQDRTAITDRYHTQEPRRVAYDLAAAAGVLADEFDRVDGERWERTGRRSDGASFTVASFARYYLHDPVHHIVDVERGYEAIAAAGRTPAEGS